MNEAGSFWDKVAKRAPVFAAAGTITSAVVAIAMFAVAASQYSVAQSQYALLKAGREQSALETRAWIAVEPVVRKVITLNDKDATISVKFHAINTGRLPALNVQLHVFGFPVGTPGSLDEKLPVDCSLPRLGKSRGVAVFPQQKAEMESASVDVANLQTAIFEVATLKGCVTYLSAGDEALHVTPFRIDLLPKLGNSSGPFFVPERIEIVTRPLSVIPN